MDLQIIQNKIFEVRGCRVMLDYHLAELYQVETRFQSCGLLSSCAKW